MTEAVAPPQNSQALTQPEEIVVDIGDAPTLFRPQFKIDREFWLVNGMEVTVTFDASVPDPAGTNSSTEDGFNAELARIAADPLIGGRRRGLAVVISRREWWSPQDKYGNIWDRDEHKTNHTGGDTIFSVSIPGDRPYATLVGLLKFPKHKKHDAPWLPVHVSASDRRDVEVFWDEVEDRATLRETIAEVRADRAMDRARVGHALTEQQPAVADGIAERAPLDLGSATTLADAYQAMACQQAAQTRAVPPQQAEPLLATSGLPCRVCNRPRATPIATR